MLFSDAADRFKIVFFGLFLVFVSFSPALAQPEIEWTRTFGGWSNEQGLALLQMENGNIAFCGNEGSFDEGGTDGWIMVLNEEGEEIWSRNYGGRGYDRFCDFLQSENGWICAGYNGSQGNGRFDFWLSELDEEGDMLWQRFYGGDNHERCSEIIPTADGGYLLCGSTYSFGNGNEPDGWVVKTDAEGNQEWAEPYGGDAAEDVNCMIELEDGYVLFGYTASQGAGGQDIWIINIDAEGEVVEDFTIGGEDNERAYYGIPNEAGNYILAGITNRNEGNENDGFIMCASPEGEVLWETVFEMEGDNRLFNVSETVDGGYILTGNTYPHDDARAQGLLIKTDGGGETLWIQTYGGNQADPTREVIQTADFGYAVIGWTRSEGNGEGDAMLVKFEPELTGYLEGFVSDEETGDALADAVVQTSFGQSAQTGEEGFWRIEYAAAGEFDITASLPGYNDFTHEGLELEANDSLEIEFHLTHPEFEPSVDEIDEILRPDEQLAVNFSIANPGNGPLEWSVGSGLRGEADADPWTLRQSYNIGQITEDNYIHGVLYIEDRLYVSGGNDGNPLIYIFNLDGELIDSFEQPEDDRRGFRDLAFDGELIWGAIDNIVYGITLDGEVVHQFESQYNPTTAMTWDSERECLWLSSTTSDPLGYDVEGNHIEGLEIDRMDLRIYGLAFRENDPDGCQMYVFHEDRDLDLQTVHKIDLDSNDTTFVAYLEPEAGGGPAGAFLTNQLDYLTWVLFTASSASERDGGDRVDIWQIEANTSWLSVEPHEGSIEAEADQELELLLDATDLIPIEYPGELRFTHNAAGGEASIPVTLTVTEGPHHTRQELDLALGWNLASVYLQPDDEDMRVVMQDLVDQGVLSMVKDGFGRFYYVDLDFNNIPGWNIAEGYWIKTLAAAQLALEGMSVAWDEPIDLPEGWSIASYYPHERIDAVTALSGIVDNLIMAKDEMGRFYIPEFNFSNMGEMQPGKGYQVKTTDETELIYRREIEEGILANCAVNRPPAAPEHLPVVENTGENMSLLIETPTVLAADVGVYAGDILAGSGRLIDGYCGIAVMGDDPSTEEIEGAIDGQILDLLLVDESGVQRADYKSSRGELKYRTDDFRRLTIQDELTPSAFEISGIYPNPFNFQVNIRFSTPENVPLSVVIYDVSGREISKLYNGVVQGNRRKLAWNASDNPAGIYIIEFQAGDVKQRRKIVLMK